MFGIDMNDIDRFSPIIFMVVVFIVLIIAGYTYDAQEKNRWDHKQQQQKSGKTHF